MKVHWPLYISMTTFCIIQNWLPWSNALVKKAQISWVGTTNDCLNDNGIENADSMSMRVFNAKAPSFSNFDLNGHFYEYGWSDFLRTFTNGFFDHKKVQDSTKINTVWCNIRYLVQIVIFRTPHRPPSSDFVFWTALSHFLADFNKKKKVSKCSGDHTVSNKLVP